MRIRSLTVCWEWLDFDLQKKDNSFVWVSHAQNVSDSIEKSFTNESRISIYDVRCLDCCGNEANIRIDFSEMVQTNKDTGIVQLIRRRTFRCSCRWEFQSGSGWAAYSLGSSELLELAKNSERSCVSLHFLLPGCKKTASYFIDLVNMTQTSISSGLKRGIRNSASTLALSHGQSATNLNSNVSCRFESPKSGTIPFDENTRQGIHHFGPSSRVRSVRSPKAGTRFRIAEGIQEDTECSGTEKEKAFIQQEADSVERELMSDIKKKLLVKVSDTVQLGCNVNYATPLSHNTPLHQACAEGFFEIARVLVVHKANVNAINKLHETPLHLAAFHPDTKLPALLIKHGAEIDARDKNGHSPLIVAVQHTCYDVVKLLIQQGARIDVRDNNEQTLFHLSVLLGWSLEVLSLICEEGLSMLTKNIVLESQDTETHTPLFLACMHGHVAHAQLLLEHGAGAQLPVDCFGNTPFDYGKLTPATEQALQSLLSQESASRCVWGKALISASREGDQPTVCLLLQERQSLSQELRSACQGADVDYQDALGRTALHEAVFYGHVDLVTFLVCGQKASITIRDNKGIIPGMVFKWELSRTKQSQILDILHNKYSGNPRIEQLFNEKLLFNLDGDGTDFMSSKATVTSNIESRTVHRNKVLAWGELDISHVIGEGSFGIVRKAVWRGMEVAVKELKGTNQQKSDNEVEDLQREGELLARVCNHSCVLQFVGITISPLAVVTKYMKHGNVERLLVRSKTDYPQYVVLQMALEAALGIQHLHTEEIIHRDLAARNLLVDESMHVKVADFGFARVKEACIMHGYTLSEIGPIKWTAPEAMRWKQYSEQSDIFSFGVVLYEMLVRHVPWDGFDNLDVVVRVCKGERMPLPETLDTELLKLIQTCWAQEAVSRPTLSQIITVLKKAQTANQEGVQCERSLSETAELVHSYSTITVNADKK